MLIVFALELFGSKVNIHGDISQRTVVVFCPMHI
jgi:hypothetical protein